ncbi:RNA-binding protein 4B-like isoform X1 [Rhinatrema bivittatum]|uniref:RNA-binding protein 4B-like isoform X1 n=1 Tax=Rhinatrema bivittatum TaxID=194408 RepID=UPI00112B1FB0|nr:RNA-binding protein 4B-like isoform X1 [Rhinatrema bivittatum]XP_029467221.1 RNA-binding protein 4B-like isoform X1 [Rhinatrema bivittatum]
MVKLFVGNLPCEATEEEIRGLFEQFGKVLECDIVRNYGFVHMEERSAADEAVRNLNHYKLHGVTINVEASKSKIKASTKLHVGNISSNCTNQELRAKFEEFGPVIECDIVKDYAFVHMERAEDAVEAIKGLDNTEFKGKRMHVQLSTSQLRTAPGMGDKSSCYRCGKEGHWSKECPIDRTGYEVEYADTYANQYTALRPSTYPSEYGERIYYDDRDRYGVVDYYQRYRVRPYATTYEFYADRRLPPFPPFQSTTLRERLTTTIDAYERRLLPPPLPPTSYFTRDRSPLRRSSSGSSSLGATYTIERTRLSPVSSVSRSSLYDLPRYGRESYVDRSRYSAF